MAESEYEIRLSWENGVGFSMTSKLDGGDVINVISTDENNHIKEIWPSVEGICRLFFDKKIRTIGDEMKS